MKIIAVDDDDIALDLLGECLSQGGYEDVTLVTSPIDALRIIRAPGTTYDCILLDISMPQKSGIELCADIRELDRYRSTPILMITKHHDQDAVERAFANGATDYITKPINPFEVVTRIRIAERLVLERQAAIDSYIALQNVVPSVSRPVTPRLVQAADTSATVEHLHLAGDQFLPLNVFSNYLEQIVRADDFSINLVAVKIRNVDLVFSATSATEFVKILEATAEAVIRMLKPGNAFATHAGNGVFLCAVRDLEGFEPAKMESALWERLKEVENASPSLHGQPLEVVAGTPLTLTTTQRLNFNRARRAAVARADNRETELSDNARLLNVTQTLRENQSHGA